MIFISLFAVSNYHPADAARPIELTPQELELVAAGEVILREAPIQVNDGMTFEAIGLIKAPVEAVYEVVTDFGGYPEFMPNVSKVEVLSAGEGKATVNFTLGLPLGKTKKYRVNMQFQKSGGAATLRWNMIEWPGLEKSETIDDTEGYWILEGRAATEETLVLYHVFTDPGHVPLGLGWIVDILSKNSLPKTVLKTRDRVYEGRGR
jgi:hypothetical protein